MVVIAVTLAAFLISFAAILSVSVAQIQRNQVADTYEAVFTGVDASDMAALKDLPEFARVGEYYLLGQEHSEQGYKKCCSLIWWRRSWRSPQPASASGSTEASN